MSFAMKRSFLTQGAAACFLLVLFGCGAGAPAPRDGNVLADRSYLTSSLWDDGRAEVAFYRVERTHNPYGQAEDQSFLVGTYLVKHDFDPVRMAKAAPDAAARVPAFKYALFYELESGSYQYKRHWVVNARQDDLAPLKHSFTTFDWCSNVYDELAFQPDGTVRHLRRSDDYGNAEHAFDARSAAFTVAQLPLLVRALDFFEGPEHAFSIVLGDGTHVPAQARLDGREPVAVDADTVDAERIVVTYGRPVPSLVGEESDTTEVYWRGTGPERRLLRLEGASGRYRMVLVELIRSPYWEEDLWPRLQHVRERP